MTLSLLGDFRNAEAYLLNPVIAVTLAPKDPDGAKLLSKAMVNPGKDKELKAYIRGELERGVKVPDIAEYTKVPKNTIRRWKRNLERHGSMDAPPIGNAGGHKSLTSEQEHYLLGYIHGRPDAHLTEMQKVLKEAFNHDVSLPTISRTLKFKGCMKGFNKTRQIRTAAYTGDQELAIGQQAKELHAKGSPPQSIPAMETSESRTGRPDTNPFEEDLERHLAQHLEQDLTAHMVASGPPSARVSDTTAHQYKLADNTQGQLHYQKTLAVAGTDTVASHQPRANDAIDPALG